MSLADGLRLLVLVISIAGIAGSATAQIFRYVDANGKVHFTDDPSKIPRDANAQEYARRAYACDNIAVLGGSSCFHRNDARYMTVALKYRPGGETRHRIPDPGNGIPVSVKGEAEFLDSKWLHVVAGDKEGWIAAAFIRHE